MIKKKLFQVLGKPIGRIQREQRSETQKQTIHPQEKCRHKKCEGPAAGFPIKKERMKNDSPVGIVPESPTAVSLFIAGCATLNYSSDKSKPSECPRQ